MTIKKLKYTVVLLLVFLSVIPSAYASEPRVNIVTLGDSYFANPPLEDTKNALVRTMLGLEIAPGRVSEDNDRLGGERSNLDSCPKADVDLSIPKQLSLKTQVRVYDYSCASTTLYTKVKNSAILMEKVELAISDGALNRDTQMVPILVGFNDTYRVDNVTDGKAVQEQKFAAAIDEAIGAIRNAAPHARIVLMSYPSISEPGTARQCLIHKSDGGTVGVPAIWIEEGELNTREFMQKASVRNHTEFLDIYQETLGRGECASDDIRIIAGVRDENSPPYNLGAHMNTRGVQYVSTRLAEVYASRP